MVTRDRLPEGLLADVKNYLNITWTDETTDKNIGGLIASGMMYLNGKYGSEADYTADGALRMLLFDYVRYARDNALNVFERDFLSALLTMQHDKAVMDYALELNSSE